MKDIVQFCADFCECPPPQPRFHFKFVIVQEYAEEHRHKCSEKRMIKTESIHSNLHGGILSKEDTLILINCGTCVSVWKDHICSQTCMSQITVRGKLFRDFRCSDMKIIDTHGPETHYGNSRSPVIELAEQDCRKGKVTNTKKQRNVEE